jgi:hypothetical protein
MINGNKRGYVIASEQQDFLQVFKQTPLGIFKGWCLSPEIAKVYETYSKASRDVKKLDVSYRVWILELWETDKQFIVGSSSEDKPDWLT